MIRWHRLLGLTLKDFFTGTAFTVELEKDLSYKAQLLDIVVIKRNQGQVPQVLPDGLENLSRHNLITYKSLHEALDPWALEELLGHYVNYRKQVSPAFDQLLPATDFSLYGISTRFPQKLSKALTLTPVRDGVYDVLWGIQNIRLIVLSEISTEENNAIWQLFSGEPNKVKCGVDHYAWHLHELSGLINQLFERYKMEGFKMSYEIEDFLRDSTRDHIHLLSPDERLQGLSSQDLLKRVSPDERLRGLSPDERLKGLSPEQIKAYLNRH